IKELFELDISREKTQAEMMVDTELVTFLNLAKIHKGHKGYTLVCNIDGVQDFNKMLSETGTWTPVKKVDADFKVVETDFSSKETSNKEVNSDGNIEKKEGNSDGEVVPTGTNPVV
ncbi:MAG: hypothetical protein ACREBJ_10375, partial [Nitrosotalea sp.]